MSTLQEKLYVRVCCDCTVLHKGGEVKNARVISVIETTLTMLGEGVEDNPVRILTQYWTVDGDLLASVDKWKEAK